MSVTERQAESSTNAGAYILLSSLPKKQIGHPSLYHYKNRQEEKEIRYILLQ